MAACVFIYKNNFLFLSLSLSFFFYPYKSKTIILHRQQRKQFIHTNTQLIGTKPETGTVFRTEQHPLIDGVETVKRVFTLTQSNQTLTMTTINPHSSLIKYYLDESHVLLLKLLVPQPFEPEKNKTSVTAKIASCLVFCTWKPDEQVC